MRENGSGKSTWHAYLRLAGYARPYTSRLIIGIVAGFLCGGTNFGLLTTVPQVVKPLESGNGVESAVTVPAPEAGAAAKKDPVGRLIKKAGEWGMHISDGTGRVTREALILVFVVGPVLVLLRSLAMYLNRFYIRWVGARVVRDIRDELFSGLQQQSLKFFGKTDVGQMISNCTNDAALVEHMMSVTVADLTRAPFEVAGAVGYVVWFAVLNHMMGPLALALVIFPVCIIPISMLGRRLKRYSHQALARISVLVSRMHENFTGIRVVKAFHMEERESARFRGMNKDYFRSVIRALRVELLMHPAMEAVAALLALVFLAVCYKAEIRIHQIIAIGLAGVMAYRPIKGLVAVSANLQRGAAALDRIYAVLDTDTSLKEAPNAKAIESFRDRIVFDGVSFRYADEGELTVRDIGFEIRRGQVVAVAGETGAGKTTLANLLARFYDPTEGRVLLDGTDLRALSIASLRATIGVVTQETILFNETIAENIAYGREGATRKEIEEAAQRANAHEFILSDPAGYDRVVGEKGFVLSGGERQRVAIARAILKNPPILILDEAMSALDTVTERLVQEAIAEVMKDRTVFAIAHRLSTIRHADLILLMDQGRIAERGTHDELYNAGGRYRRLCDMQVLDATENRT